MCKGLRFGSNNKRCGSRFTGDCLLPLLHKDHSGFIKPQNAGPENKYFAVEGIIVSKYFYTISFVKLAIMIS